MKYTLTGCSVIDGTKGCSLRENCNIFVDGAKIVRITDAAEQIPSDYKTIDLSGKYVMPGLINMHAHLFGTGKPSKSLGGGKSQERLIKFMNSSLGMKVLLKLVKNSVTTELNSGVTTVRGVGDLRYSDVIIRDRINAGKMNGPRMLVSGPAITVPGGHGAGTFAEVGEKPDELRKLVQEHREHGVDFIKICVTGGVMDAKKRGEPGELRMNIEQTRAVCDEAHKYGYLVASHTESPEGVETDLLGGVDTVEHGSRLDDKLIALFKEKGAKDICTISAALPLAKLSHEVTQLNEFTQFNAGVVMDGIIECARKCLDNGIPVALGTDASCTFVSHYNTWMEMYYFIKYVGVTNAEAIYCGTLRGAEILGIDKITGSVEEGKCADLIVLSDDPLEDITTLKHPEKVIFRGKIIDDPKVKRLDVIDKAIEQLV